MTGPLDDILAMLAGVHAASGGSSGPVRSSLPDSTYFQRYIFTVNMIIKFFFTSYEIYSAALLLVLFVTVELSSNHISACSSHEVIRKVAILVRCT